MDQEIEHETGVRLTILTVLILTLIGVLIVYTGVQAVSTERVYFRELTLLADRAVAKMVAREFAQVFYNVTGWIESLSQFPAVRMAEIVGTRRLFDVMLRNHQMLRFLYLTDPTGKILVKNQGIGASSDREFHPLSRDKIDRLVRRGGNFYLSDPYLADPSDPKSSSSALTYAVRVENERRECGGILAAEIGLHFLQDIVSAVNIGQTGQILVAARGKARLPEESRFPGSGSTASSVAPSPKETMPEVIFSSPLVNRFDIEDFRKFFPVEKAFHDDEKGFDYEGLTPKIASYACLRNVVLERYGPLSASAFPVPASPERTPDWLVVVQQSAQEGYVVADRLKYNVIVLVLVGLAGLGIISKLWMDSLNG